MSREGELSQINLQITDGKKYYNKNIKKVFTNSRIWFNIVNVENNNKTKCLGSSAG